MGCSGWLHGEEMEGAPVMEAPRGGGGGSDSACGERGSQPTSKTRPQWVQCLPVAQIKGPRGRGGRGVRLVGHYGPAGDGLA
jgi:hypothetical protein